MFKVFSCHFFQQMAELVKTQMSNNGTHFLSSCVPVNIEKTGDGKLCVDYMCNNSERHQEVFDTVLFAVGKNYAIHLSGSSFEGKPKACVDA